VQFQDRREIPDHVEIGRAETYPAQTLYVSEVGASLSELIDLSSQTMADAAAARGIVSIGPDVTTGGLHIGYDRKIWSSEAELRARIPEHVKTPRGKQIPLRFTQEEMGENSTR